MKNQNRLNNSMTYSFEHNMAKYLPLSLEVGNEYVKGIFNSIGSSKKRKEVMQRLSDNPLISKGTTFTLLKVNGALAYVYFNYNACKLQVRNIETNKLIFTNSVDIMNMILNTDIFRYIDYSDETALIRLRFINFVVDDLIPSKFIMSNEEFRELKRVIINSISACREFSCNLDYLMDFDYSKLSHLYNFRNVSDRGYKLIGKVKTCPSILDLEFSKKVVVEYNREAHILRISADKQHNYGIAFVNLNSCGINSVKLNALILSAISECAKAINIPIDYNTFRLSEEITASSFRLIDRNIRRSYSF